MIKDQLRKEIVFLRTAIGFFTIPMMGVIFLIFHLALPTDEAYNLPNFLRGTMMGWSVLFIVGTWLLTNMIFLRWLFKARIGMQILLMLVSYGVHIMPYYIGFEESLQPWHFGLIAVLFVVVIWHTVYERVVREMKEQEKQRLKLLNEQKKKQQQISQYDFPIGTLRRRR